MKALFTLLIIFVMIVSSFAQVFVKFDANGANNGSSWTDAYSNLQSAIDNTPENGQIWVASGTYHPNIINSPSDSNFLFISKPLKLYGGFVGSEISLDQRDWESNPSLLSGDINNDDIENDFFSNKSDNTMHVLFITDDNVIIDGFTISYGKTRIDLDNDAPNFHPWRAGGIYSQSTLVIRNCIISQNIADYGGGIYASYQENINLDNCTFVDNYAVSYGAGIVVGNSNALVNNCTFKNNISEGEGGGISLWQNTNAASDSNVVSIKNTVFDSNQAQWGGGLDFYNFNLGSLLNIDSCFFFSNRAILSGKGGGISIFNNPSSSIKYTIKLNVSNTVFDGNSADSWGGAILNYNAGDVLEVSIQNCDFNENKAFGDNGSDGGGILNLNRTSLGNLNYTIESCNFIENITKGRAGAIYNTPYSETHPGPNGIIKECTFIDNFASDCCGAIYSGFGNSIIEDCLFENNGTSGNDQYISGGGGISFVANKSTQLRNSIFKGNYSGTNGSAILFDDNINIDRLENLLIYDHVGGSTIFINSPIKLSLINSSIVDNETGIVSESSPNLELQNNIFMNDVNFESIEEVEIKSNGGNISSDNTLADYFVTSGDHPDLNETDPLLDENYIPLSGSPAIDAGNPDGVLSTTDAVGNPRIQGLGIDAGAIESPFVSAIKNVDWDNEGLIIFPNPVGSKLYLSLDIKMKEGIKIEIYNQLGQLQLIRDNPIVQNGYEFEIDVEKLESAVYFIIAKCGNKKYGSKFLKH
jgi:hypothetical protein